MSRLSRLALSATAFLCLAGAATISAPSFASEAPASTATAMLAAVTGPLLAVDVHTLEARKPDFSTQGDNQGSSSDQTMTAEDGSAQPTSLADLVADHESADAGDPQTDCLATSVYYESKGEPLEGQLAVAQTIINRTKSDRFPDSICGVVRQPSQFSFVHHGDIPEAPHSSSAWRRAVAIAVIAEHGLWKQVAPEALFFHARRVSPGWGKLRVASIGHHIFLR